MEDGHFDVDMVAMGEEEQGEEAELPPVLQPEDNDEEDVPPVLAQVDEQNAVVQFVDNVAPELQQQQDVEMVNEVVEV